MNIVDEEQLTGLCLALTKILQTSIAENSIPRNIFGVNYISTTNLCLDNFSSKNGLAYLDVDLNKIVHVDDPRIIIPLASYCSSTSMSRFEIKPYADTPINILSKMVEDMIAFENDSFIKFLFEFCKEDHSFCLNENMRFITSLNFNEGALDKYCKNSFKNKFINSDEILTIADTDIRVYSGSPNITHYFDMANDNIVFIASMPNFAFLFLNTKDADIKRMTVPDTFVFNKDLQDDNEQGNEISYSETIFRAMNREEIFLDV